MLRKVELMNFFARSRTTQQLVDNLLIPAVEKMMFQDEDKQKKIISGFF